jgi:hypothetical protein
MAKKTDPAKKRPAKIKLLEGTAAKKKGQTRESKGDRAH